MAYQCTKCTFTAPSYYKLTKHCKQEHLFVKDEYKCDKCSKVLSSKQSLDTHKESCIGLNALQCKFCKKQLCNKVSKCRHQKICKMANKEDLQPEPDQPHHNVNNSNNLNINGDNNIIHNIITNNNNTVNNVTNNNYTVKFELEHNQVTPFISSHITPEEFKIIIDKYFDVKKNRSHLLLLDVYNSKLFTIPENRCIKKTNIKSKKCKVHTGNGAWMVMEDNLFVEKLVIDLAKTFADTLQNSEDKIIPIEFYNKRIYTLRGKTEHLTGTIFQDEKELIQELNQVINNTMSLILNYSK